jgi:Ni/Fe-hydrogenase subunit HybB-like protein
MLRMLAMLLVVGGLVAYRWDTNMVGQMVVLSYAPQSFIPQYASYAPSLIEVLAAAGTVAFGLMAFTLGVRHLHVVDHTEGAEDTSILAAATARTR